MRTGPTTFATTFNQVPPGAWTAVVSGPAGHVGTYTGAISATDTTVAITVAEMRVRVTATSAINGAPAMAFTTCALKDFVVEQGQDALGTVKLVDYGERGFCTRCGTSLTIHVNYQKDEIDVACASLDDPGAVTPEFHIFVDQKIGWVKLADGLPTYAGFGVEERGLEQGDRPE